MLQFMFPLTIPCTATLLVYQESLNSSKSSLSILLAFTIAAHLFSFAANNHLSKLM